MRSQVRFLLAPLAQPDHRGDGYGQYHEQLKVAASVPVAQLPWDRRVSKRILAIVRVASEYVTRVRSTVGSGTRVPSSSSIVTVASSGATPPKTYPVP